MRHHPQNISLAITDPRDILQRAVWVGFGGNFSLGVAVPKNDLVMGIELSKGFVIRKIIPFVVRDRERQDRPLLERLRKRIPDALHPQRDRTADKME